MGLKCLLIRIILLLAPTNNYCDVSDERLQRGIPLFGEEEEVWMNVLPVCRRLGIEKGTLSLTHLRDNDADMLSASCREQFREGITLCTLGSVY